MKEHKISIIVGVILVAGLLFYGGYEFGTTQANPTQEIISDQDVLQADTSLLWEVVQRVKEQHIHAQDTADVDLLYGAISGALTALDDPYTTFFPPEDAQKFEEDINGSFGGIGAEIGVRDNQLIVISPLKGNPAEAAGLQAKDKILKVDDTYVGDMAAEEAVKIIRGEKGTDVTLLIMRDGWAEAREIVITRDEIVVPTLDWEMKDDKIAYIQLYSFNGNASQQFYDASFNALLQGAKGLVFDLRNNSGGYLNVANYIAGWFLDRGDVIVQETFPSGESHAFRSNGNGAWRNIPVVLLVNGGSASASEIVAGALRDQLGSTLVGETTFGKGTVQELETLEDGSKLKLSIAEWLTPDGNKIDGVGLEPDIEVSITEEDIEAERDAQLEEAMEIIREQSKDIESIRTIIL